MGREKESKGRWASHQVGAKTGGPRQPDRSPVGIVVPAKTDPVAVAADTGTTKIDAGAAKASAAALEPVAAAIDLTKRLLEPATAAVGIAKAALEAIPAVLVPPTRAARARETNMGNLTRDMTRLHDEIVSARKQRTGLLARVKRDSDARKEAVDRMTVGFHTARMAMKKQMAASQARFLGNLQKHVAALRDDVASDLAGAHRVFFGGRT